MNDAVSERMKSELEGRHDIPSKSKEAVDSIVAQVFKDRSLYGYADIDGDIKASSGCDCALVTLMPFPDMERAYRPAEFYQMSESLRSEHTLKMAELKRLLDAAGIRYAAPPAAPGDDGEYRAKFSYKWAAAHAGLGFIGKNDVFVHYRFGQRVRISCLLLSADIAPYGGEVKCECGDCELCVKACPHNCLTGAMWTEDIIRSELIDYKRCATWSRHEGKGQRYLCCYCAMACQWHMRAGKRRVNDPTDDQGGRT